MKKFFTLALFGLAMFSNAQIVQAYADRANVVNQNNLQTYNSDLVAFGIRKTGTTQTANALAYLKSKYSSFGYTNISEQTFTLSGYTDKNLIVTKTGTTYPDEYIIICGHYDSYSNSTTGKHSVGANDNASGVAVILEAARILQSVPTEYSIKFINFSGEEQGLLGSKEYVSKVVNSTTPKMKIKLVLNLDQVGGMVNSDNNTIFCERDEDTTRNNGNANDNNNTASNTATQQLKNYVGYYTDSKLSGVISNAYGSDYMPFENNSEIITGLYERTTINGSPVTNTYYHNNTDVINNLSYPYIYEVARIAVGALQHFAVADLTTVVLPTIEVNKFSDIKIYPNPAKDFVNIDVPNTDNYHVEIYDMSGRTVYKNKNQKQINTSKFKSGVYNLVLRTDTQSIVNKLIVK